MRVLFYDRRAAPRALSRDVTDFNGASHRGLHQAAASVLQGFVEDPGSSGGCSAGGLSCGFPRYVAKSTGPSARLFSHNTLAPCRAIFERASFTASLRRAKPPGLLFAR